MRTGRIVGTLARRGALVGVACAAWGIGAPAAASAAAALSAADAPLAAVVPAGAPSFAPLVKRYGAAVVNISVTREVAQVGTWLPPGVPPDHPLAALLGRRVIGDREEQSLGSGCIVSADGYIVTSRHVVGEARMVDVKLPDKREFKGRVIGSDALSDIAVVKVEADDLPAIMPGDPARVQVGDWVVAIGSPYGFANTVTAGIVGAKGRTLPGDTYVPFLQTDVPINPGNSGGPLFDLNGRVIGINAMIYSKTGGYQGISFAVPIDVALNVKDQLLANGYVRRGRLGVGLQDMSQPLAQSFGLARPDGALVTMTEPDGPGARAGLRAGDVVQALDGAGVADTTDLLARLARLAPGARADLMVWRGGRALPVSVRVGGLQSPGGAPDAAPAPEPLGVTVRPLTPQELQRAQLDRGLLVQRVSARAARLGLKPGDIVLSVNETAVASVEQFAWQVGAARTGVALLVQRGNARFYVPLNADA
jgi:serine protease Do